MQGAIFSLASQGVWRKKKSSILIFLVLLLSFSFAITSLSLVGSIAKTNAEFRLDTYGEWFFGIPSGTKEDAEYLANQPWAEQVGMSVNVGNVKSSFRETGFGTVDETLKDIGRLKLDSGHWPANDNEIAMEADTLGGLGYDYSLGQEITFEVSIPVGESSFDVERTYTLCGLIHEYSDLWQLNTEENIRALNGAIVTEATAEQVLEEARARIFPEFRDMIKSVPQYFISVAEEDREGALEELKTMLTLRATDMGEHRPCQNFAAYPGSGTIDSDTFYVYAIAAVALLAVLCIYIMQLPAETHSFAVLRSIGITRGQMAVLLLTESMILCLPAVLLGIPCGIAFTWLAMKLVMYSGSVDVLIEVPWTALKSVLCLWIVMVLLTRLMVYAVIVRTPLTGKMQMQRTKFRRTKTVRNAFIVLLVSVFGAVTIFTVISSVAPNGWMKRNLAKPAYHLSAIATTSKKSAYVTQEQRVLIEKVPGIQEVTGWGSTQVSIAFDETEIRHQKYSEEYDKQNKVYNGITLYVLDETQWEDTFELEEDREDFHNGDLVIMCFPKYGDNSILPQRNMRIRLYENEEEMYFESEAVPVSVRYFSGNLNGKNLGFALDIPYTVICSNAYMQTLLDAIGERRKLGGYTAGNRLGESYPYANAYVDWSIADLSTDFVVAEICNRNNIWCMNDRQVLIASVQDNLQTLILLYSSGVCIVLITLLILYSAFALEAEQEKRYFKTMRIIGMSERQMYRQIVKKALVRSCLSVIVGWICYFIYSIVQLTMAGRSFTESIKVAFPLLPRILEIWGYSMSYVLILSIICLLVPLALSLAAKCKLRKENMLS